MPTWLAVRCPHCQSDQIAKRDTMSRGTQRYLCQHQACTTGSFLLDYRHRGCVPEVLVIADISGNTGFVAHTELEHAQGFWPK
jgi:hypothetical protein